MEQNIEDQIIHWNAVTKQQGNAISYLGRNFLFVGLAQRGNASVFANLVHRSGFGCVCVID